MRRITGDLWSDNTVLFFRSVLHRDIVKEKCEKYQACRD